MKTCRKVKVKLKPGSYQPSKAELEEPVRLDVPGDTWQERMDNLADAILKPAEIEYE